MERTSNPQACNSNAHMHSRFGIYHCASQAREDVSQRRGPRNATAHPLQHPGQLILFTAPMLPHLLSMFMLFFSLVAQKQVCITDAQKAGGVKMSPIKIELKNM
ncbi:hypothetical protein FKM82_027214 [Ascaphus truei]